MENSQLLITFTDKKKLNNTIDKIKKSYDIAFNKIFILKPENNTDEIICSYNITVNPDKMSLISIPRGTISVHRKKSTNTLYTINALNYIISTLNDGNLDTKFSVPWENYKNCILVITGGEFKKIKTKLLNIIHV